MLTRLCIENFGSIKSKQDISFVIDGRSSPLGKICHLYPFEGVNFRIPKVIGFWGPNGSGKTTILKAIEFVFRFIDSSHKWSEFNLSYSFSPHMSEECRNKPTSILIQFVIPKEHYLYTYKVNIKNESKVGKSVLMEEFYRQTPYVKKKHLLFRKNGENLQYKEEGKTVEIKGRKGFRSSFAHVLAYAKYNSDLYNTILDVMCAFDDGRGTAYNIFIGKHHKNTVDFYNDKYREDAVLSVSNMLAKSDSGINGLLLDEDLNEILFHHRETGLKLRSNQVSSGIRRIIEIYPPIYCCVEREGIALIDDIDLHLHSTLLRELIFSEILSTKYKSQLIFTTHRVELMDEVDIESIFFVEDCDTCMETKVIALKDYNGISKRRHTICHDYMSDSFGGIPLIG